MTAYQYVYVMKGLSKTFPEGARSSRAYRCHLCLEPRLACSVSMGRKIDIDEDHGGH